MYDCHCFITHYGDPNYRIRRIRRDGSFMHLMLRHNRVSGCFVTVVMDWTPKMLHDYCNQAARMLQQQVRHTEQFLAEPRYQTYR